jgi:hypothetical protein
MFDPLSREDEGESFSSTGKRTDCWGRNPEDDERNIDDGEYDARRIRELEQQARWVEGGRRCLWHDECMTLPTRIRDVDGACILSHCRCSSNLINRIHRMRERN